MINFAIFIPDCAVQAALPGGHGPRQEAPEGCQGDLPLAHHVIRIIAKLQCYNVAGSDCDHSPVWCQLLPDPGGTRQAAVRGLCHVMF